jgi:chromosome segregation ATPase
VTVSRTRPDEQLAGSAKSGRSSGSRVRVKKSAKAREPATQEPATQERSFAKDRGATGGAAGQIEEHDSPLESYLRGLTEHRNSLHEYLCELVREREELEREREDLNLKIAANEKKRERVTGYIEEIPLLRDKALRSLVKGMDESE